MRRRLVLLCLVALPGCLVGRSLYLEPDESIEVEVTANAPQNEGGPQQGDIDGSASAPEGQAPATPDPDPTSPDAGADASRP